MKFSDRIDLRDYLGNTCPKWKPSMPQSAEIVVKHVFENVKGLPLNLKNSKKVHLWCYQVFLWNNSMELHKECLRDKKLLWP